MKLFVFNSLVNDQDGYDCTVEFSKQKEAYKIFSQYTAALGRVLDKKFDVKLGKWKIKTAGMSYLKKVEADINNNGVKSSFPTALPGKPVISKPAISGYENMGAGLKLPLYCYQKEIVKFCFDTEKALICAPCGAGKTPVAIAVYDESVKAGKISGPAMIVVKASLKQQWAKEVEKFSSYRPRIIQTLSQLKKDTDAFMAQFNDADIFIVNYEQLRDLDIKVRLKKKKFQFVFCDEIQYCKDDKTKRSKAVAEFADAKFTIGATATPVQKNPMDIFGIFKFINPALFPRKGAFGERYVKWVTFGQYIKRPVGSQNEDELNQKLLPWMIVKTKQEISSQLPSLVVLQRYCTFTDKQKRMSDILLSTIDNIREQTKAVMMKLAAAGAKSSKELKKLDTDIMMYQSFAQELANDELLLAMSDSEKALEYVTGDKSTKTEMLVDLVKEILESGEKVAIFSRFRRYQSILISRFKKEKELADIKVAVVNGIMSDKQRYEEVYEKFERGDHKILLLSDSGAEGLNLSSCGYLVELDLALSYAVQTQRHGRVERADSTHKTVYVYQLLTEDSYDDIQKRIVDKKETFDATIIKGEEP